MIMEMIGDGDAEGGDAAARSDGMQGRWLRSGGGGSGKA